MQHLTKQQITMLLEVARKHSERDYLIILLAYRHGLRATEVCSLKVCQFDSSSGEVFLTVQRLKGSNLTVQPLFPEEKEAVLAWIAGKGRNEYLFPGRSKGSHISRKTFFVFFREHCRKAGIPKHLSHPHSVKHSIAMHAIQKAGIEFTRVYLGHKNLQSTAHYLKADDASAAAAVAAALRGA